jgi:hypothetical protein
MSEYSTSISSPNTLLCMQCGPPINHKNPQPLPYPSSTALQSNGYLSNASFMTSPSYSSFTEVPNDIAEVYPPGHDHLL